MPLLKIVSTAPLRLDLKRLHSSVMGIFNTPSTGVQITSSEVSDMYPAGIFVEMRAKAKPERDAAWMKQALGDLTLAFKDAGAPEDVRIRCEMFDEQLLYKNC
ncbi:hypothetical protein DIPPA_34942 [Diplonema papillatum]|nr:hypothetical protein DIPPA_34942 [Diplonema papillatum]|eukprot:gene21601-33235_t